MIHWIAQDWNTFSGWIIEKTYWGIFTKQTFFLWHECYLTNFTDYVTINALKCNWISYILHIFSPDLLIYFEIVHLVDISVILLIYIIPEANQRKHGNKRCNLFLVNLPHCHLADFICILKQHSVYYNNCFYYYFIY